MLLRKECTGSPWLMTICSATVQIYDSTKQKDLWPMPKVMAVVVSPWSHDQSFGYLAACPILWLQQPPPAYLSPQSVPFWSPAAQCSAVPADLCCILAPAADKTCPAWLLRQAGADFALWKRKKNEGKSPQTFWKSAWVRLGLASWCGKKKATRGSCCRVQGKLSSSPRTVRLWGSSASLGKL